MVICVSLDCHLSRVANEVSHCNKQLLPGKKQHSVMINDPNIHDVLTALVFPLLTYCLPGAVKINTVPCSIIINEFPDSLKGLLGFLSGLFPCRAAKNKLQILERKKTLMSSPLKYDSSYYLLTTDIRI